MAELARALRAELEDTPLAGAFEIYAEPFFEASSTHAKALDWTPAARRGMARVLATHREAARFVAHRSRLVARIATLSAGDLEARAVEVERLAPPPEIETDLEVFLDELRLFRREETVFAAVADLGGLAPFETVAAFLSRVAETCARWALHASERTFGGDPSRLAIVGLGKVAGRELTYYSDLDLVFLYPGDPPAHAPARRVDPVRIAQRFIAYLTTMTGAGVAYAVDSRLRPSGHQGMLVSTFASFERYQRERAATWEHLAVMRARAIAGAAEAAQHLLDATRREVIARHDGRAPWREIDEMRRRIESERPARPRGGRVAFKTGAGGLMDVEFLATGGLLERGPVDALPALPALLESAAPHADLEPLLGDYAFLRRVEARARWLVGRAVETVDPGDTLGPALAELVEPGATPRELAAHLDDARTRIRAGYDRVIGAETIEAL